MCIVSHKYRFIFLKSRKTASSSVHQALAAVCGPDDIVSVIENREGLPDYRKNYEGVESHIEPDELRQRLGEDIWRDYLKVVVVRNPWDETVSRFNWWLNQNRPNLPYDKKAEERACLNEILSGTPDFRHPDYVKRFRKKASTAGTNLCFYFDSAGRPLADRYIRYESLSEDFNRVFGDVGIPLSPLPHLKGYSRICKAPYWEYFDDEAREIVARGYAPAIDHFGYRFGPGAEGP